jgi:multiple sugar transport system substrate-binding protein
VDPGRHYHFLPPDGSASIEEYKRAGWNAGDAEEYTTAYFDNFNAEQQFPYLRIPATFEYWTALDTNLSEAVTGQAEPEEALQNTADEFAEITERLGREQQLEIYKTSLNLE